VQERALQVMEHFSAQALANTLWSFAHFGHVPRRDLLAAIEARVVATADAFQVVG